MFITVGPMTKGEREKGGHVLRDTTSRGLYVRVRPPHTSERPGEGEVVSKEVGGEERSVIWFFYQKTKKLFSKLFW